MKTVLISGNEHMCLSKYLFDSSVIPLPQRITGRNGSAQ